MYAIVNIDARYVFGVSEMTLNEILAFWARDVENIRNFGLGRQKLVRVGNYPSGKEKGKNGDEYDVFPIIEVLKVST
jgi:hypothetical protein